MNIITVIILFILIFYGIGAIVSFIISKNYDRKHEEKMKQLRSQPEFARLQFYDLP